MFLFQTPADLDVVRHRFCLSKSEVKHAEEIHDGARQRSVFLINNRHSEGVTVTVLRVVGSGWKKFSCEMDNMWLNVSSL